MIVRTGRRSHNALSRLRMADRATSRFTPKRKKRRRFGKLTMKQRAKLAMKRKASEAGKVNNQPKTGGWQKRTADQSDDRPASARGEHATALTVSPARSVP